MINYLIIDMDNEWIFYCLIIGPRVILTCYLFYLIRNQNANNLIRNQNANTPNPPENIDAVTDSDFDTSIADMSDYQSIDTLSTVDFEDIDDQDLFFLPNVDIEEYSVHELKIFEVSSLYSQEIKNNGITEAELQEIIDLFSVNDLLTNDINDLILAIITYYHK
jgi:hypothetical protein